MRNGAHPLAVGLTLAGQQSSAMRKLGKDVKKSSSRHAHDETLRDNDYVDMGGKGGKGAASPSPPAYVTCEHIEKGTPKDNKDTTVPTSTEYDEAVDKLDMKAVKEDMATLLIFQTYKFYSGSSILMIENALNTKECRSISKHDVANPQ